MYPQTPVTEISSTLKNLFFEYDTSIIQWVNTNLSMFSLSSFYKHRSPIIFYRMSADDAYKAPDTDSRVI